MKLNENTPVSLAVVSILVALAAWLANTQFTTVATAAKVEKIETKQDKYGEDISDIKRDIAVIREKVDKL